MKPEILKNENPQKASSSIAHFLNCYKPVPSPLFPKIETNTTKDKITQQNQCTHFNDEAQKLVHSAISTVEIFNKHK